MNLNWLKSEHPDTRIVTTSKDLVDALLSMNTRNRSVKRQNVERLKRDIKAGAWHLTASGIGVSRCGILLDGQNRLIAIKEAGYPALQMSITVGLAAESQFAIDRHSKRSMTDAISLSTGTKISNHAVAAVTALLRIKNAMSKDGEFAHCPALSSDKDVADLAERLESTWRVVMPAAGKQLAGVSAALIVYHWHRQEQAEQFADQLRRQLGMTVDHPAYRLVNALKGLNGGGASMQLKAFGLTASACMAHSKGRGVKLLRPAMSWASSGWTPWMLGE